MKTNCSTWKNNSPFLRILALDTATDACSVALLAGNDLYHHFELLPRQHNKLILPMLDAVLAEAGISLKQLDAIAFTHGPGSFTGIRIATSVVQAAAFAYDLPVIPLSTLHVLAQTAWREYQATHVLAILDAAMQEVYWGNYCLNAHQQMELLNADRVTPPVSVRLPFADTWHAVGSGWDKYHAVLAQSASGISVQGHLGVYPHAQDVVALAVTAYQQGKLVSVEEVTPVYLREEIVKK